MSVAANARRGDYVPTGPDHVEGRKRAPLTLEQAICLRPVQQAVLAVLANTPGRRRRETPDWRSRRYWSCAPAEMTRLHSSLPLAEDRTFTLVELIDFYVSEGAALV